MMIRYRDGTAPDRALVAMLEKEDVRVIQRAAPRRRQGLNADARYPRCPPTRAEVLALAEQARQQRQAFRERLEERQGVQIPA